MTTIYSKTEIDARYLQLSGGTMTAGANVTTTGNIGAGLLVSGDATYQLLISQPTSTTASSIQTVQQGVGFNKKLTLQTLGGNVGIANA